MERLHPRVRVLWIGRIVVIAVVLGAIVVAIDRLLAPMDPRLAAAVLLALAILGTIHALLLYRRWRYELQDDALFLVRGVLTRTDTSVPYVRVQHVDTQRGPIERAIGLANVVVYTAGSRGADIEIPGLTPDRASDLRERLRDLAVESESSDAV